jgi:hypothetical protein
MWIKVAIPYEPEGKLAFAYNREMEDTNAPWVALCDHDLFLSCNPHWYEMCLEAVKSVDEDVVMLTCTCNGNSDRAQAPVVTISKTPSIDYHVHQAKRAFRRAGDRLDDVLDNQVAGFFMLVRRSYWEQHPFKCQGKGVNKIDHAYIQEILDNGYKIKVMKGLYMYHRKKVRKLNWKINAKRG